VLHTAKSTRQIGVGKEVFCRVPFIGHMVKEFAECQKTHGKEFFLEN